MVNVRAREEREPKIKIGGKSWLIDTLIKSMFSINKYVIFKLQNMVGLE